MFKTSRLLGIDGIFLFVIAFLITLSVIVLHSITPSLFPSYYVYILIALMVFYLFSKIEFEIFSALSSHLYILSIILLITPLVIGQVTRGAIRWIPIGSLTIQPSEIVRPFLLLYFAKLLTDEKLDIKKIIKVLGILFLPFLLILIQPSLGVAILTLIGFFGVLLASSVDKRYLLLGIIVVLLLFPLFWLAMAPYQKQRVVTFLDPQLDRYGAGYNSIQSMIAVGSGKLFGRGLGEGVQTQLAFLPEKHTDFIFASIAEEMGFVGNILLILGLFVFFWILIAYVENAKNPMARAYVAGVFLVLFAESLIHIGMNMGMLPITGVPLPFVSAGGSALVGTIMSVAIAINVKK